MKKGIKIVVLIFVYLFLCGRSCQDDQDIVTRQLEEIETMKDNIRDEFGNNYLTEEAKYASEQAAIQKVNDLADYLEIYGDVSIDPIFREKAGEMIRNMFISENVRLPFELYNDKKKKYLTLDEFLDFGFGKEVLSAEVSFEDIRIDVPLNKTEQDLYKGTITALQKMILVSSSGTLTLNEAKITISIQASQKAKIFGQDTLKTWAVNLGDMTLE